MRLLLLCFSVMGNGFCSTIEDRKMTGRCRSDFGDPKNGMDAETARAAVSRLSTSRESIPDLLASVGGWSQSRVDLYLEKVRKERMMISRELFRFLIKFNLGKVSRASVDAGDVWNVFLNTRKYFSYDTCTAMHVWYRVAFRNVGKPLGSVEIRVNGDRMELVGQFHETYAAITDIFVRAEREPGKLPPKPTTSSAVRPAPEEYKFIPPPTSPVFVPSAAGEPILREILLQISAPPFQMPSLQQLASSVNRPVRKDLWLDVQNVAQAVLNIVAVRRSTFDRLIAFNEEGNPRILSRSKQTSHQLARWYQTVILSRVGTPIEELGIIPIEWNRLTYMIPPPEFVLELLRGEYPDWLPRTDAVDALGLLASTLEQADA